MNASKAIELQNVSFSYPGEEEKALDAVTVSFERGKCYCITGPNGCGKSTLFRILLGLDFATEGHYYLDGQEITEKSMKNDAFANALHKKIGFLFQDSEVQLFTRSVEDEIAFGLEQMGLDDAEITERVNHYISIFRLEHIRHRAPFNISGGEKKRTALAAVCAMEPEIFIMDEPLAGLDEDGQKWITDFIRESRDENRLFIISTHNKEYSDAIADEIIQMNRYHQIAADQKSAGEAS